MAVGRSQWEISDDQEVTGNRTGRRSLARFFIEIVAIDLGNAQHACIDTHLMVDHQTGETGAIHKHDAFHRSRKLVGLSREG